MRVSIYSLAGLAVKMSNTDEITKALKKEMDAIKSEGKSIRHYNSKTGALFIYDPKLGEIFKAIHEGVYLGEINAKEAINEITRILSKEFEQVGITVKPKRINSCLKGANN